MNENAVIRARISESLKADAAAVLAEMGLTVSDVMRMTLTRVAKERRLPFDAQIPNATTRKAIDDATQGRDITRHDNAAAMYKKLGI